VSYVSLLKMSGVIVITDMASPK